MYLPSQLERQPLLVMVDRVLGEGYTPHPHQAGLILPSLWNVRQKVAIATLCILGGGGLGGFKESIRENPAISRE